MLKTSPDFDRSISALQTSHFFAKVEFSVLEDMLKEFTLLTIQKATTFDADMNMKYFHIILKGRLRLMQVDPKTGRSIGILHIYRKVVYTFFRNRRL